MTPAPVCKRCGVGAKWIDAPIKDDKHYTGWYCPRCNRIEEHFDCKSPCGCERSSDDREEDTLQVLRGQTSS
jgi:hypothetical protein